MTTKKCIKNHGLFQISLTAQVSKHTVRLPFNKRNIGHVLCVEVRFMLNSPTTNKNIVRRIKESQHTTHKTLCEIEKRWTTSADEIVWGLAIRTDGVRIIIKGWRGFWRYDAKAWKTYLNARKVDELTRNSFSTLRLGCLLFAIIWKECWRQKFSSIHFVDFKDTMTLPCCELWILVYTRY